MTDASIPSVPFLREELDLSDWHFRKLLASGRVRQALHGVYVEAATPDSLQLRATSAARLLRPGHVFVDRTAAWLHGVDALAWGELDVVPPVEVAALPDMHPTERAGTKGRNRDLLPSEVTQVGTCPVTTPLRTALDLGCNLWREPAYAAMNELARLHDLDFAAAAGDIDRFKGRRGVTQLRDLMVLVDPRIESAGESRVRLPIHEAGLPAPEPQVVVSGPHGRSYRLDFAWRHIRVAVEYDGKDWHGTADQIAHDEERREWLQGHGWTIVVVTSGDLWREGRSRWVEQLSHLVGRSRDNLRW